MEPILNADLLINPDGSIYHLKLKPEQLADTVLLVGDPDRVSEISRYFDHVEVVVQNREFITHTGILNGKRITVLSTGIGTDNIDIVIHELDALANIDLKTRQIKSSLRSLDIIRIGTSGTIQPDVQVDTYSISTYGIGFDNLLRFYHSAIVIDEKMVDSFMHQCNWNIDHVKPYIVKASGTLMDKFKDVPTRGFTMTAPGFYGPQGRKLRIGLFDPEMISKLQKFNYHGERIINFEMETSALYGLGALLGHNVLTICALIANRANNTYSKDHKPVIKNLVEMVLDHITAKSMKSAHA
jgi:uridine phosphorylase